MCLEISKLPVIMVNKKVKTIINNFNNGTFNKTNIFRESI